MQWRKSEKRMDMRGLDITDERMMLVDPVVAVFEVLKGEGKDS